jgi:hypothetical protein
MSRRGDHLDFTLEHMLPALLAEAQGVGGDRLMFDPRSRCSAAPRCSRSTSSRAECSGIRIAALGAMLSLGLLMPQVSFSRDSTTEIPMQVLLFTAAWLLCDRRTLVIAGAAFTAGLFLGLLQAIHVDGLAFVVGSAVRRSVRVARNRTRRAGASRMVDRVRRDSARAVGVALGFFDLVVRSQLYLRTLRTDLVRLSIGAAVAVAVAGLLFAMYRWWSRRASELVPRLQRAQGPGAFVARPPSRSAVSARGSSGRTCRPCADRPTSW